jgi:hypothetical protein
MEIRSFAVTRQKNDTHFVSTHIPILRHGDNDNQISNERDHERHHSNTTSLLAWQNFAHRYAADLRLSRSARHKLT